MAFRRRRFVRRKTGFRRRKVFKRRSMRRRRRQPVLYVKITRSIHVNVEPQQEKNVSMQISLNDFAEHVNLAANFERVKVLRQVVRVFPQQNVSNSSTSRIGSYCLFPYHKPAPSTEINFPTALSIDKAKVFRGTSVGRMSFVPASRLAVDANLPAGTTNYSKTEWKPEFEIGSGATTSILYTGMFVAENINTPNVDAYYTIIQDLYVRYKNQRSFI